MAYCERADVEDIFGIGNIKVWADLDNEQIAATVWAAETTYAAGVYVTPTTANGFLYFTDAGGDSGKTEPKWPDGEGETVGDGDITWTAVVDQITARINRAIEAASAEIDDRFRRSVYVIPFVPVDGAEPAVFPTTLVNICATLAGVWLYEARGVQDFDPATGSPVHRQAWKRNHALGIIKQVLTGTMDLDCERGGTYTPDAVVEDDEDDE